jgi:hypothetical protein
MPIAIGSRLAASHADPWFRHVYGSPVMPDAASAGRSRPRRSPAQPTPSRRSIVGRALVLIGLLVFVFDRSAATGRLRLFGPLAALTLGQIAVLGAATAVAYIAGAGPYRVLVPALSWPHAVGSDLAARAVVSTVPGPTDVATRFVLYRQWSIPTDVASAGIAFAALFETFSYLALPLIATLLAMLLGLAIFL